MDYVKLDEPLPQPVLVTATSDNHVGEARNLTLHLAKDHPTWKFIIYDIGLKQEQRKWFQGRNYLLKFIKILGGL